MKYIFDLIVIGGGHAGVEAALVGKRSGLNVGLITLDETKTGRMSCNPAIGGIGKSHLAKEIDALGGYMCEATDLSGIQFRTLNKKKGPAVQATRAQTDKELYEKAIQEKIKKEKIEVYNDEIKDFITKNKKIKKAISEKNALASYSFFSDIAFLIFLFFEIKDFITKNKKIKKAISEKNEYEAKAFVLTTGTFLNGSILIGHSKKEGGRIDEKKSTGLERFFKQQKMKLGRLKTGTPPRLCSKTIDYSLMEEQPGDEEEIFMSFMGSKNKHPEQKSCHITQTNKKTHKIIKENIKKSAMYSGLISGVGPRYCPSIEDKIIRFAEKNHHQIFVEPEGLKTNWVYPNGISTSLPKDVQEEYIQSIKGFESAKILQYGYAVEYDYIDPRNLNKTLSTKQNPNLFLAGQINGTTGYEEAGAQGIVAGINASLYIKKQEEWVPERQSSYLGVLVDDLTRLGVSEPYRMFTSRAEHRLLLRQNNADKRMFEIAKKLNIINEEREEIFLQKQQEKKNITKKLQETKVNVEGKKKTAKELCKRNDFTEEEVKKITNLEGKNFTEVYFDIRYSGYIDKQQREMNKMKNLEEYNLGFIFDYKEVAGLSGELQERLNTEKPNNLYEASNIEGITPAAINVLTIHLKKIDALRSV